MANPSENVPQASVPVHGPMMRAGLKVYLTTDRYEVAQKDNVVQLALNAIEDPEVDLEKIEWYCSINGQVWMLQQHSDDENVYTLCLGPSRTGGRWL